MPAQGTPGALTANLGNPLASPSGAFGGNAVALKLDIDFSAAGFLPGTSGLEFGSLFLTGLTGDEAVLNGMTVSEVLGLSNIALGGGAIPLSISELSLIDGELGDSFEFGTPDAFALNNLTATTPSNTVPAPEPPSLVLLVLGVGVLVIAARWSKPEFLE